MVKLYNKSIKDILFDYIEKNPYRNESVFTSISRFNLLSVFSKREYWKDNMKHFLISQIKYKKQNALNSLIKEELINIVQEFKNKGIPFVVLKGLPLAYDLYEDINEKISCDIDILVEEFNCKAALLSLSELGYLDYKGDKINIDNLRDYSAAMHLKEFKKECGSKNVFVELHTVPFSSFVRKHEIPQFSMLLEAPQFIKIDNTYIPVLELYDRLLHLTDHFSKHLLSYINSYLYESETMSTQFNELKPLYDLALFLNKYKNLINWNELVNKAFKFNVVSSVYIAFLFINHLFDHLLPGGFLSKLYSMIPNDSIYLEDRYSEIARNINIDKFIFGNDIDYIKQVFYNIPRPNCNPIIISNHALQSIELNENAKNKLNCYNTYLERREDVEYKDKFCSKATILYNDKGIIFLIEAKDENLDKIYCDTYFMIRLNAEQISGVKPLNTAYYFFMYENNDGNRYIGCAGKDEGISINDRIYLKSAVFDNGYTINCLIPWDDLGISPNKDLSIEFDLSQINYDKKQHKRTLSLYKVDKFDDNTLFGKLIFM